MAELDKKKLPFHIAIIPDGNRRWAKRKGLELWKGHYEGAKQTEAISRRALDLGVKCLTFWGSSKDNLIKRPFKEKVALLDVYEKYFKKLIEDIEVYRSGIKIRILGDWENQLPLGLKKILRKGISKTQEHENSFLNFLLAYDGGDDILTAVENVVGKVKENVNKEIEINDKLIWENLITSELPEVDLVIRTGVEGDPHNSAGFLMWQTKNSQFYFSEKMFPDFGPNEFEMAITDYQDRERRLGK